MKEHLENTLVATKDKSKLPGGSVEYIAIILYCVGLSERCSSVQSIFVEDRSSIYSRPAIFRFNFVRNVR